MKIKTKPYGEIEIDDRQLLSFPSGILGFETLTEYALLDAAQQPFYWLQSVEVPDVAFVLIQPGVFRDDYDPGFGARELEELRLEPGDEKMLVFSIVTIPENQREMTANLQGPVVINRGCREGRQMISSDPRWKTRHKVLEEMAAQRKSSC